MIGKHAVKRRQNKELLVVGITFVCVLLVAEYSFWIFGYGSRSNRFFIGAIVLSCLIQAYAERTLWWKILLFLSFAVISLGPVLIEKPESLFTSEESQSIDIDLPADLGEALPELEPADSQDQIILPPNVYEIMMPGLDGYPYDHAYAVHLNTIYPTWRIVITFNLDNIIGLEDLGYIRDAKAEEEKQLIREARIKAIEPRFALWFYSPSFSNWGRIGNYLFTSGSGEWYLVFYELDGYNYPYVSDVVFWIEEKGIDIVQYRVDAEPLSAKTSIPNN